jgi:ribosomal protein L32
MNITSRMTRLEAAIVSGRLKNCPECGNPPPKRSATTSTALTPQQANAAKSFERLTDHLQQAGQLPACPACGAWNLMHVPDEYLDEMERLLLIVKGAATQLDFKPR